MGTRCPQCQAENAEQSKFCAECGSRLGPGGEVLFTKTMTLETGYKVLGKGKIFAEKYGIIGEIGRGGMGVVYKAEDTKLKRTVALKFLPPELRRSPEARERFIREAQSAAALSHPNICTIHEVEEADGQPYIAMEFVRGESLRQRIAKGAMDSDAVADIAVQVAEGLEAAHQRGIIHRDIKSANIMVTEKGRAKIMDFGLAKVAGESQLTKEAMTIGTIAYMSPEQAQGEDLDERTDIWSFGVVLYEMLTGQLPFRGDRETIILHAIVGSAPRPLRQVAPGVPAELQGIIDRALRKKREDRYASAGEMAADLRRYFESRRAEEAGFFNLKSLTRRLKRPTYFVPAAALLIVLSAFAYWRIDRSARVRWARQVALPQIEKFIQSDDFTAAYKLTRGAARFIAKDPQISEYSARLTGSLTLSTEPSGAQVFLKDYAAPDSAFELVGLSPLDKVNVPIGYKHFKIVKDGFATVEGTGTIYRVGDQIDVPSAIQRVPPPFFQLDPQGYVPAGMVHIRPFDAVVLNLGGLAKAPPLSLADYLLDRFEVTNRQYEAFMADGGYRRPEFWKEKFIRDGKAVPRDEAMKSFVDKTGRPGPATWEFGEYPEGQDEYPVSGVSWYEAAAYAEYAGKSLPTAYHWKWAAGDYNIQGYLDSGYIIPLSNFGLKGPVPAGQTRGISHAGVYDLAGNLKEWCWNETSDGKKGNVGGAWDEPSYIFGMFDCYPAWFRYPDFGFRCMRYLNRQSSTDAEAAKPLVLEAPSPLVVPKPCSEEMFQAYLKVYEYAKSPLNARLEEKEDWTRFTTFAKVSFEPAYVGQRMGACLFLPKEGKPPFQTVIHWPGGGALLVPSILEYGSRDNWDRLTKTGRAVVLPILGGTFDRKWTEEVKTRTTGQERRVMMIKDFLRTVDYLESRAEFDMGKLAYEGLSWGAGMGRMIPAIEKRIKAVVLIGADIYSWLSPDYSPFNFTPRIAVPVLIQNGTYDFTTSVEQRIKPFLRLFGTPEKDKELKLYDAGHAVWMRMEQRREEIDFLDKVFGPAK